MRGFGFVLGQALVASAICSAAAAAEPRAIDGDTFEIEGELIRLAAIDAPELHTAKCDAEWMLASVAKTFLMFLLAKEPHTIERFDQDQYARTIARVTNAEGENVAVKLAEMQVVRYYDEREGRKPWCEITP